MGPASRPVSIPEDFGPEYQAELHETIVLPNHLWWSGQPRTLDPVDRSQLIRLYEIVLTQGTTSDVKNFISFTTLRQLWGMLFLPEYVKAAWENWFTLHPADR